MASPSQVIEDVLVDRRGSLVLVERYGKGPDAGEPIITRAEIDEIRAELLPDPAAAAANGAELRDKPEEKADFFGDFTAWVGENPIATAAGASVLFLLLRRR